jgi:hypothetical protein
LSELSSFTNLLQLLQQRLEHASFAGAAGDKVDDAHLVGLFISVDASHPLLQPRGIPRDVVVDHQPAGALQVNSLGSGVGADHVRRAAVSDRTVKEIDLLLTFEIIHRTMDFGDLPGEAHRFEALHDEIEGVAMFGEDEDFLIAPLLVADHLPQPFEFGIFASLIDIAREVEQLTNLAALGLELTESSGHHSSHRGQVGGLVFLEAIFGLLFVGSLLLLDIAESQPFLARQQFLRAKPSRADIVDKAIELRQPALERTHQRISRAGEAALKDAHRKARCRPIQEFGPIVVFAHVVGRAVIQRLLADSALRELIAQRV